MKQFLISRKIQITVIMLVVFLVSVLLVPILACKKADGIENSPYFVKLEAERALFIAGENATGQGQYSVANSKSEFITSGGKFISSLRKLNDRIVWTFQSSDNVAVDFYVAAANAGAEEFVVGGGNVLNAKINGSSVYIMATKVFMGSDYFDAWQLVKISSVLIKKGYNFFELEVIDTNNQINIDYLGLDAKNVTVQEHLHDGSWTNFTVPATCEHSGRTDRTCSDCGISYHYLNIAAIGHNYTSFHYDEESEKMMQECRHCGDKKYANAPFTKYYGEVFESEQEFEIQRQFKTVYEAEWANINTKSGLNNGTSPIEYHADSSNGAHVANISRVGNHIEFRVISSLKTKADLMLVLSNVLYTDEGIGILSPMSTYVLFTINGESVDFSYVDFPGDENFNYYNWRFVVIKNIDLVKGDNVFILAPKYNNYNITIPNTDTFYLFTDEDCLEIIRHENE